MEVQFDGQMQNSKGHRWQRCVSCNGRALSRHQLVADRVCPGLLSCERCADSMKMQSGKGAFGGRV